MLDIEAINLINWIWAVIFVPIGWFIRSYLKTRKDDKKKKDDLIEKALKSFSDEEFRNLVKEEIAPLVARQDSLEDDFKETNKAFHEFTQSFYAKINEVMLSIVGLKK